MANPLEADATDVVLQLVSKADVDPRLLGAAPWLLARHSAQLDWERLVTRALGFGSQNRLGYMLHLALEADYAPQAHGVLSFWKEYLAGKRSPVDDTYGNSRMSTRERAYMMNFRTEAAAFWHVLTNERVSTLKHYGA